MDIGKAFGFVFEDPDWIVKLLIGALIALIPIFGQFALIGYTIAIIRNVMDGHPRPLPAWDNLGAYFVEGLKFWVVTLVYGLPMLLLLCPVMFIWVLPALGGSNEDLAGILAGAAGLIFAGLGCIASLYSLLVGLLTPALQIRMAETGQIGACLRVGEIVRFAFAHIGSILIALVMTWLAGLLVGTLAGITFGLLALPARVWMSAFMAHMYGQIGRNAGIVPLVV